jgi:N utilization substance protein B
MVDKKVEKLISKSLAAAPEKRAIGKNKGSAKARKTSARLAAVQVLYQMRLNNQDGKSAVKEFINHRIGYSFDGDVLVPADEDLLRDIVAGVENRWTDIEEMIAGALSQGRKAGGEVETLLEGILRAGVWEILENTSTDTGIIIHDYLNVTASFYDGTEPKLVNAVLDRIAKTVRG